MSDIEPDSDSPPLPAERKSGEVILGAFDTLCRCPPLSGRALVALRTIACEFRGEGRSPPSAAIFPAIAAELASFVVPFPERPLACDAARLAAAGLAVYILNVGSACDDSPEVIEAFEACFLDPSDAAAAAARAGLYAILAYAARLPETDFLRWSEGNIEDDALFESLGLLKRLQTTKHASIHQESFRLCHESLAVMVGSGTLWVGKKFLAVDVVAVLIEGQNPTEEESAAPIARLFEAFAHPLLECVASCDGSDGGRAMIKTAVDILAILVQRWSDHCQAQSNSDDLREPILEDPNSELLSSGLIDKSLGIIKCELKNLLFRSPVGQHPASTEAVFIDLCDAEYSSSLASFVVKFYPFLMAGVLAEVKVKRVISTTGELLLQIVSLLMRQSFKSKEGTGPALMGSILAFTILEAMSPNSCCEVAKVCFLDIGWYYAIVDLFQNKRDTLPPLSACSALLHFFEVLQCLDEQDEEPWIRPAEDRVLLEDLIGYVNFLCILLNDEASSQGKYDSHAPKDKLEDLGKFLALFAALLPKKTAVSCPTTAIVALGKVGTTNMAFRAITALNTVIFQNLDPRPLDRQFEVADNDKAPGPETALMDAYASTFSVVQALLALPRERLRLYKVPRAMVELVTAMERALSFSKDIDPARIPNAERVLNAGFDTLEALASDGGLVMQIFDAKRQGHDAVALASSIVASCYSPSYSSSSLNWRNSSSVHFIVTGSMSTHAALFLAKISLATDPLDAESDGAIGFACAQNDSLVGGLIRSVRLEGELPEDQRDAHTLEMRRAAVLCLGSFARCFKPQVEKHRALAAGVTKVWQELDIFSVVFAALANSPSSDTRHALFWIARLAVVAFKNYPKQNRVEVGSTGCDPAWAPLGAMVETGLSAFLGKHVQRRAAESDSSDSSESEYDMACALIQAILRDNGHIIEDELHLGSRGNRPRLLRAIRVCNDQAKTVTLAKGDPVLHSDTTESSLKRPAAALCKDPVLRQIPCSLPKCEASEEPDSLFKRCPCKLAHYCSLSHQMNDWAVHKLTCASRTRNSK